MSAAESRDARLLDELRESLLGRTRFTARVSWLLDAVRPPRPDVHLVFEDGRLSDVAGVPCGRSIDLRPWCVIPPLVNAHTHLEFSDLPEPLPPGRDFTEWIRTLVGLRHDQRRQRRPAIAQGVAESLDGGVSLIGEIATSRDSVDVLSDGELEAVVFQEALGLSDEACAERLQQCRSFLADTQPANHVRRGLSPHAPYTVHPSLLEGLVRLAAEFRVPVAMHLAETREELQLLRSMGGPFREMLEQFGVWNPTCFAEPRSIAEILESLRPAEHVLVVHGNYLTEDECRAIAADPRYSVVVCPRTCRHFGHVDHPWPRLLQLGARVIVGTDGRGSNPDLDLLSELKLLRKQQPGLPVSRLLKMASIDARVALGFALESDDNGPERILADGFTLVRCGCEILDADRDLLQPETRVLGSAKTRPGQVELRCGTRR